MPEDLRQEWLDLAPAWIRESRDGRNPTRNGLLDPPMLAACGDVCGLAVLDCGCGEGRFCRILGERGARTLGLDLCTQMIAAANALRGNSEQYRVADVQDLGFLADASFDLAMSYLNQCDLPDSAANTREVWRVLKPGGRFIIANLHPMRSASGAWCKNTDGDKQHVAVDRYFDEGVRRWPLMGTLITNFHRSLSTQIREFIRAGFIIEDIDEPSMSEQGVLEYPELADELRVPNFIIYVLRKA